MTIRAQHKPSRHKESARVEFVRGLPCLVFLYGTNKASLDHVQECTWSAAERCEANHIRAREHGIQSGMATKPDDDRILPFCWTLHQEYTRMGKKAWCDKYDITSAQLENYIRQVNTEYDTLYPVKRETPRKVTAKANYLPRKVRDAHAVIRSVLRAWSRGEYCDTSPAMQNAKEYLAEFKK